MVHLKVLAEPAPRAPSARVALISLTMNCNARCAFCCVLTSLNRPELNPSDDQIRAAMAQARADGCTTLSFTGGEPTVHPRFAEFCREGRALGYTAVTINTNGIKFKSRAWTEAALAAGLSSVDFSVHGHTAALHDALVERPGAFDAIVRGAGHLAALAPRYGAVTGATVVVTHTNAPHLPAITDLLLDLGFRALRFKHCFEGGAGSDAALVEAYAGAIGPLREAIARADRRGAGVQVTHFPLCLLGEEAIFTSDLLDEDVLSINHAAEVIADGRASLHRRADAGPCAGCLLAGLCPRLDVRYPAADPAAALRPVADPAALTAVVARAARRHPAQARTVRSALVRLLARHGAAVPPAEPEASAARCGDETVLLGPGDAAGCGQTCAPCDCRYSPTPGDSAGVPPGVRTGGRRLVLRGEAAAHPAFGAVLAAARDAGWDEVWVRTTGARFRAAPAAQALRAAGAARALVPLFAHRRDVHDRVAGRPGALVEALVGLRSLAAAGLAVAVEVPLLPVGLQDLEAVVRLAHQAVPALAAVRFHVARHPQPPALAPPPWGAVRDGLARALAACAALGVAAPLAPADGVPRCALPAALADRVLGPPVPLEPGAPGRATGFVAAPVCAGCAWRTACLGPTQAYWAAHGARDLTPG